MSIQLSVTQGLDTYPQAYAKITAASNSNAQSNSSTIYSVEIWKSVAHKEAREPIIEQDRYEVLSSDLSSVTFAGMYAHLKTQEKYSNGLDV